MISESRQRYIRGQEKHAILAAIARALKTKRLPPMDERLKSIVAAQIGLLRSGGWSLETICLAGKDLALAWDEKRGHNRLAHLAARVRALDADRERRAHVARKLADKREWSEKALKNMALLRGVPHPNTHDYIIGPRSSCAVCEGPIGVHVRPRVEIEA